MILKTKSITLTIIVILFTLQLVAQEQEVTNSKKIKTVLIYKTGQINSMPIINLQNPDESITLAFDDLEGGYKDLQYKIIHCEHDWKESDLFESDFLEGNSYEALDHYDFSFNTYVNYTNYICRFPSDYMKVKLPGNYLIKIYSADNEDSIILSRRFYVVDQQTSVNLTIKRPGYAKFIQTKQEIDFTVNYNDLNVMNPMEDINVAVRQNQRWDNMKTDLKPNYIQGTTLNYDYEEENLFFGETEWRYVDMRSLTYPRSGVGKIELDSIYQMYLLLDEDRSVLTYTQWSDINGNRVISSTDRDKEFNELDYVNALFRLTTPYPDQGEEIYLFGAFSDWKLKPEFKLKFNSENNIYYINAFLKQGYYNYYYAVKDEDGMIDCERFQGSHYETENDYHVFVYYKSPIYNTDLLVGYVTLNSVKDK